MMDLPGTTYLQPAVARTFADKFDDEDLPYIRADIHEAAIAKRDERIAILMRALEDISDEWPHTNAEKQLFWVQDRIAQAKAELERWMTEWGFMSSDVPLIKCEGVKTSQDQEGYDWTYYIAGIKEIFDE